MENSTLLNAKTAICIVLFCFLMNLAVSSSALEMSSKRDCVVCHIMWMDDFRTDKETLIKWQPGNVLMRDTQGVVSSEEICYSCHDGYIRDSRATAWKYNRHPVYVKPSLDISVPITLPLSVKDEVYCGTCHSAHGKGAAPHGDPTGETSFFREVRSDSALCEMCHIYQSAYKLYNGHPLHTNTIRLPDSLFAFGAVRADEDKNMVICQTCHKVHGAKGEKLLIVSNKDSGLCITCHENQKMLIGTKHDLRTTMPEERNIKQQPLSESGPCGACHVPHRSSGKRLWARTLRSGNPATQMCMTCHGKDAGYKIKGIGIFSHPIDTDSPLNASIPKELPLFAATGAKDPSGKVQCFTCHDVHVWDPASPENRGGKDIEGDSSNSFLRVSNSLSSDLCTKCHADKEQLKTSDHNLEVTAAEEKNIQGFTAEVSGPCGACHIPHNAESENIWAKKLPGKGDLLSELCTGCHSVTGAANEKVINISHPIHVTLEKFGITTTLPLYDASGNRTMDGKIVCITCHDPHIWDPEHPVVNYPYKNMEGNASNSFLRNANYPSSELCKSCHSDKALVDGTDHDLTVSAPESKNLLDQTAMESGPCGACHLVHNGPNRLKLWARPLGFYYTEEGIINALCTGCHSRDGIGQKKVPLISTHPKDRLVNNVLRSNRKSIDYAPIFDEEGKEVNVGNISCPTCHNAHQWSPLIHSKGEGINLEGNATNSFLRNVSYNNICIDCHGLDALFRYKYYHNPKERVETQGTSVPITFK